LLSLAITNVPQQYTQAVQLLQRNRATRLFLRWRRRHLLLAADALFFSLNFVLVSRYSSLETSAINLKL